MRKLIAFGAAVAAGVAVMGSQAATGVAAQTAKASKVPDVPPVVFQAAGPNIASIQSMIDAFRAALGGINNGNVAGPLADGRREINWDGGGSTATSPAPTPFDGFLLGRGARFITPGSGFVQAPVEGLATTFANPAYADIFQAFSPVRLFSAVGSTRTDARFFIPGGGELPAATRGFGAIFSDVDLQEPVVVKDEHKNPKQVKPTTMVFSDANGKVLHTAVVPASKGDASLSFVGVLFTDARIARVRIQAGTAAPGANDTGKSDVVMMDDFIYGEPQAVEGPAAIRLLYDVESEGDQ
jgi:hypothetical protein